MKFTPLFLIFLFLMSLLTNCITTYSGGSRVYNSSEIVTTSKGLGTVSFQVQPGGLPEKDDTENRLSKKKVNEIIFEPKCPERFMNKKVYVHTAGVSWSANPRNDYYANVSSSTSKGNPIDDLEASSKKLGCNIQFSQGKGPRPQEKFDFIVHLLYSFDDGKFSSQTRSLLNVFLSIPTLGLYPFSSNLETAYYFSLHDAKFEKISEQKITIAQSSYVGLGTLFLPMYWGDKRKEQPEPTTTFAILLFFLGESSGSSPQS